MLVGFQLKITTGANKGAEVADWYMSAGYGGEVEIDTDTTNPMDIHARWAVIAQQAAQREILMRRSFGQTVSNEGIIAPDEIAPDEPIA